MGDRDGPMVLRRTQEPDEGPRHGQKDRDQEVGGEQRGRLRHRDGQGRRGQRAGRPEDRLRDVQGVREGTRCAA